MSSFLTLIGGIKGVIFLVLTVALGGWIFTQKQHIDQALLERDKAIAQRDIVVAERDKAIDAATTNDETISRLEDEKRDINFALNSLAAAKDNNRSNTVTREIIIQNQAAIAANAAQAAPVLSSIITEVQNDRTRRRGQ
ncbi:hypothetical protein [Acinetobacter sp.]|uniref:hypothetical protein n=1 Tax=Acinetobacter sp. TaxID=472 RepID=UPI00388D3794